MSWYAETSGLRTRQVLADVVVALWALLWLAGRAVHQAVQRLAAPGVELEQAGSGLSAGLRDAGGRIDDVPGIGGGLRAARRRGRGR
jgi:hypothetical protein